MEWRDLLDRIPVVMSAVGGFAAGHFYGRFRSTRDLLGATLYILYKLQRRGARRTSRPPWAATLLE